MKAFLLLLCWLPLLVSAQTAFSELHPPHLTGYYDGTINGKLPIHAYFFPTSKDLDGILNGFYRYGQRKNELHLGGFSQPDSLILEEFTTPTMDVAARSGHLRLQFQAYGSLRGTWRADKGGPRLPLELHPVAGPGSCPPTRLVQHANRWPTLATTDKQAAAVFTNSLKAERYLNQSDPGTDECTVTYVGHNLVSVWLTSEMRGASISRSHHWSTFDACTGSKLSAAEEIDPHRMSAFLEEASIRLRQQLEDYIAERGPQGSDQLLNEEDVEGLRQQEFTLDPEQFQLGEGQVIFPHEVNYSMLSNFISKEYAGRFGATFSFADLQTFLRPTSPLHRLVLPNALRHPPPSPHANPTPATPASRGIALGKSTVGKAFANCTYMKQRYLLPLLLLAPFLAHADALNSTLGEAQFYFALVMLGVAILVIIGFFIVMYSWPRWAGVPYVVGIPLLLLTWVRFNNAYPGRALTLSLLLALLLNGLVWVRECRPRPVRIAGGVAIAGSVAMLAVVLTN